MKELEEEIDKLPQEKVKPTRLLRSQQAQAQPSTAGDGDAEEGEEDEQDGKETLMNTWTLLHLNTSNVTHISMHLVFLVCLVSVLAKGIATHYIACPVYELIAHV